GMLRIMADGSAANARHKGGAWSARKGNKLGTVSGGGGLRTRKDGITHDIQKKEQAPYTGPAEELKQYEFERAARNG
ncbi:MAG: hypothetical protein LBG27_09520, partial [Spirochaetaceae bacterium]|nr:hypothetical protein [Spirochaetaceae bacterium]